MDPCPYFPGCCCAIEGGNDCRNQPADEADDDAESFEDNREPDRYDEFGRPY